MGNKNMIKAQKRRNDEFYTQLVDIENEVKHYWEHLKDNIVYCNTDNYKKSNFVKYFIDNYSNIGLKKLVALDLEGNYFEYDGKHKHYSKFETGDFRDDLSTEILKGADVVITNPPFSLFREYIGQLMANEKQFLIIGNYNAITYKEVFPLIKDNKVWLGNTMPRDFTQPDGVIKSVNAAWFTNIAIEKRHRNIELTKYYYGNEKDYPKYDNYDAIEVSRVKNIPKDYEGIMGVPITFLTKYNPEQFEVLGSQRWAKSQELINVYTGVAKHPKEDKKTLINGKETYDRIFIKNKTLI